MAVKASRTPGDKRSSNPTLSAGKADAPLCSEPSPEDLFRDLIDLCKGRTASREHRSAEAGNAEEILFDVDVDGTRYLLVRQPKTHHARVQLSPREQEIVRMVAQGHPNKIIADVLNISSWTVCTHMRRIFAKLGVASRAAMVARMFANEHPKCGERLLHLVLGATTPEMPFRSGMTSQESRAGKNGPGQSRSKRLANFSG